MLNGWVECPLTNVPGRPWEPGTVMYQKDLRDGHLTAIVAREPDTRGKRWWHISVSHRTNENPPKPGRVVTRNEMADARYTLLDGLIPSHDGSVMNANNMIFADIFPPFGAWQPGDNHPTTSHLWELPRELWD